MMVISFSIFIFIRTICLIDGMKLFAENRSVCTSICGEQSFSLLATVMGSFKYEFTPRQNYILCLDVIISSQQIFTSALCEFRPQNES